MPKQTPVSEPLLLDQRVAGQTALSKADKCLRDYFFYRSMGGGVQSHAMARGIVWHGGIDRLTAYMIENGEPMVSGEIARDFVEGYADDHPKYIMPEIERDSLRAMAWNWGEATVLDLENILGHEVSVSMTFGDWLLRCRIDLVYGYPDHIAIVDYKTSLAMPREEEVQRDFQGKFYSLAVLDGSVDGSPVPLGAGINETNFSLVFPRYRDKEHGHLKTRTAAFNRSDLNDFKMSLQSQIKQLELAYETQNWPATPGDHCSRCTAQARCPIPADLRTMPEITNVAQAQELAEIWDRMNREKTRLQKGLKGWVADNGPVYFGDLALDLTTTEATSLKDRDALKMGVRNAVEFGEPFDIDDHFQTKHSTRFGKRKQTEDEREND